MEERITSGNAKGVAIASIVAGIITSGLINRLWVIHVIGPSLAIALSAISLLLAVAAIVAIARRSKQFRKEDWWLWMVLGLIIPFTAMPVFYVLGKSMLMVK